MSASGSDSGNTSLGPPSNGKKAKRQRSSSSSSASSSSSSSSSDITAAKRMATSDRRAPQTVPKSDVTLDFVLLEQLKSSIFSLIAVYQHVLHSVDPDHSYDPGPKEEFMGKIFPEMALRRLGSPGGMRSMCVFAVMETCTHASMSLLQLYEITKVYSVISAAQVSKWLDSLAFDHLSKKEPAIALHWSKNFGHV